MTDPFLTPFRIDDICGPVFVIKINKFVRASRGANGITETLVIEPVGDAISCAVRGATDAAEEIEVVGDGVIIGRLWGEGNLAQAGGAFYEKQCLKRKRRPVSGPALSRFRSSAFNAQRLLINVC